MSVLVPKATQEVPRWQQQLGDLKNHCQWVDPWQITRLPETPAMRQIWLNLDRYRLVICVSPTAAETLVLALDKYWPMAPDVQWLCNGARTARVYESYGLTASYPLSGYTAEDVLALPCSEVSQGDEVLVVKGTEGRDVYLREFTNRGAKVTELAVYQRAINPVAIHTMNELAEKSCALWLSSQFLGESLMAQNADYWQHWSGEWWVSSARLLSWCQAQGCKNIRVAGGATVSDLKQLMQEQYGHVR